jgi:hypothetical protein
VSDIFISYSSSDRGKAKALSEALVRKGRSTWWDRKIPLGKNYDEVIEQQLNAARCVVVLWSKESVTSDWVKTEAREGKQRGILIPALIENVKPPLEFRYMQTANLVEWNPTRRNPEFDNFLEELAGILGESQFQPGAKERLAQTLERATKEHPWVNSLGMKFVPVAGTGVLFSVWDTRVQDFEAFVADTNYGASGGMWSLGKDEWKQRGATWKEPGFSQGPTHPVVGVSWNDAKKFCEWLTAREQGSGMLPRGRIYRLPTDAEWSAGVGLEGEEGNTPEEKKGKIKLYPWGKEWPPPKGAGNYAGEESKVGREPSDGAVIEGYNDGYPRTSPVGSFAANASGLYDMGGNVWQWCEDWYEAAETGRRRVLRAASWYDFHRESLLASGRICYNPDYSNDGMGFRCVVAAESSR